MENTYRRFRKKNLITRDHLAISRTLLANERTFLGYVRTAIAIFVVGATLIHFLEASFYIWGVIFIIGAILVLIIGFIRYKRAKEQILNIR